MGALNGNAVARAEVDAPPSRWQLALGSVAQEGPGVLKGWAPLAWTGFSFVYGVPGSPELTLDRPFDHFVLEAGYGASADPVATVRARGLLAGQTFEAGALRGLYGAFLSLDLDTPPRHQVSTSALGLGGSVRSELSGGLALEADAVASAVLLGAGSRLDRGPRAGDRDYRFGPGEQAYAGVRLVAGSRGSAGVALRQYLLVGAGPDAGSTELLVEGSASAALRVAGAHGLGVEVSRYVRRAHGDGSPTLRIADSTVRVFYALSGGGG